MASQEINMNIMNMNVDMNINMNRSPSLPPYSEMIHDAIDAMNEKMGSNKTTISKYIESKYGNLPAGHSTLLRHHLNRMKETGELIFWKNNYMKPNPNFIRRGRGRPPKVKGPDGSVINSPTQNKSEETSLAAVNPLAVPFKKKETRGRPRKYPRPDGESSAAVVGNDGTGLMLGSAGFEMGSGLGAKKKGRPPKAEKYVGASVGSSC